MTTRRVVVAVLGVLVGAYAVVFLVALTPSDDSGGGWAPVFGLHLTAMVVAFVALALAVKDIQSNAALDEQARSLWITGMAFGLPLVAVAYLVVCSRRNAGSLPPERTP